MFCLFKNLSGGIPNLSDNLCIRFDDITSEIAVGQWLEILDTRETKMHPIFSYGNSKAVLCSPVSFPLSTKELRRRGVSKKLVFEVKNVFARVLKMAGINPNETCVLKRKAFKDGDMIEFNCYLKEANKNISITLVYGDPIDFCSELIIKDEDTTKRFNYIESTGTNPMRLEPIYYKSIDYANNNIYERILSKYYSKITLSSGGNKLSINIDRPNENSSNQKEFRLNQEELLEKYLLGIDFPVDVFEVYRKIRELDNTPLVSFPDFTIKIEKYINADNSLLTDIISFKNGVLIKLIKSQNGKTIIIDSESWTYETESILISKKGEEAMSYDSKIELDALSIANECKAAETEVEQIRVLARTLAQDNK